MEASTQRVQPAAFVDRGRHGNAVSRATVSTRANQMSARSAGERTREAREGAGKQGCEVRFASAGRTSFRSARLIASR